VFNSFLKTKNVVDLYHYYFVGQPLVQSGNVGRSDQPSVST